MLHHMTLESIKVLFLCIFHWSFIHALIVRDNFARCYGAFFFFGRLLERRVNEIAENGLSMACDLRLCLNIN